MLTWQCIGHNPTVWGLGSYSPGAMELTNIKAHVTRQHNDKWAWLANFGTYERCGIEPSRKTAMEAAEQGIAAELLPCDNCPHAEECPGGFIECGCP